MCLRSIVVNYGCSGLVLHYDKFCNPDNRSTDPSTSIRLSLRRELRRNAHAEGSGCSAVHGEPGAVHGESVEPSRRSLCSSASIIKRYILINLKC